jgi:hypothetical protein
MDLVRNRGYDALLIAIGIGAIVLCVGFWTAAVLTRPREVAAAATFISER